MSNPSIIFADESKELRFADDQPDLIFADEQQDLIFDVSFTAFLLVGVNEFLLIGSGNSKLKI